MRSRGISRRGAESAENSESATALASGRRLRQTARRRRGGLLLEVLIALTVMVFALGLLGAQLMNGMRATSEADLQTRAAQLADRLISLLELDPATAERFFNDRQTDGDFGLDHKGWFWRASVDPTDVNGLGLVHIQILYQDDPKLQDNIDKAGLVRTTQVLKADPGRLNLADDFGMDEEKVSQFAASFPLPGLDPTQFNPQALVALSPAQLMELLPQLLPLIQQFAPGFDPSQLAGIPGLEGLPGLDGLSGLTGLGKPASAADFDKMLQNAAAGKGGPRSNRPGGKGGSGSDSGQKPGGEGSPRGDLKPPDGLPLGPNGGKGRDIGGKGGKSGDSGEMPKSPSGGSAQPPKGGKSGDKGGQTIDDLNRNRGGSKGGGKGK